MTVMPVPQTVSAPVQLRLVTPPRKPRELVPFTLPHFRRWSAPLVLDTGKTFRPQGFQLAFLSDLFAGYEECWLVVPEGNTKTTLLAIVSLYHCEFRPSAAVHVAAASREQAEILYRQAEGLVLRTPFLHERMHSDIQAAKGKRKLDLPRFVCLEGYRRINHIGGGRIQVFAADDRTGDGVIPTLGIIDEPHRHRDLALYRTWAGKLDKRQGQLVAISTAGVPGSEFEQTRERLREAATSIARKGSFGRYATATTVMHEWAMPSDCDPDDMRQVKAANPFSGITVAALRRKHGRPTMTPSYWRRFVCNLATRQENSAVGDSEWFDAASDERIPEGEPIWLGLDVAWKWDTTAAVPLWLRAAQGEGEHATALFGAASILVPPRDGTSLDPRRVERTLEAIHARNPIHTVVMDPSRAEQLGMWIEETLGAAVFERVQSTTAAAEDYERFMEWLRNGWLKHSGDPALTQHVLNAIARTDSFGTTRFDRPASARVNSDLQDRRVIDALSAASMVLTEAARNAPSEESAYSEDARRILI